MRRRCSVWCAAASRRWGGKLRGAPPWPPSLRHVASRERSRNVHPRFEAEPAQEAQIDYLR